ncbi:MAG: hypothetical protein EB084_09330 [Proteobacteria bacterium]|nr:hypothetical protein [Pseudomonadota bacterium]
MAKASRKKRDRKSRRTNPSKGAVLALVALGAVAAGGAWWWFSQNKRTFVDPKQIFRGGATRVSPMSLMASNLRPGVGGVVRTGEAAAEEAPAKGAGGVTAPGGVTGAGSLPGPTAPAAPTP